MLCVCKVRDSNYTYTWRSDTFNICSHTHILQTRVINDDFTLYVALFLSFSFLLLLSFSLSFHFRHCFFFLFFLKNVNMLWPTSVFLRFSSSLSPFYFTSYFLFWFVCCFFWNILSTCFILFQFRNETQFQKVYCFASIFFLFLHRV